MHSMLADAPSACFRSVKNGVKRIPHGLSTVVVMNCVLTSMVGSSAARDGKNEHGGVLTSWLDVLIY